MNLTILGSGTCVPSVKRASPSSLLEIGNTKILLDLGSGSLRQLTKIDPIVYRKIDIVYLSHRHTDHITDLLPLIQALNWTPGFIRKKDLYIVAHPKMKLIIKKALEKPIHFQAKFIPLVRRAKVKNIVFNGIQGVHDRTSMVLKLNSNGKSFVYSADTDYDSNISKFAKNCDVLMMENSFPENITEEGHLNSKLSGQIANEASVKKLILTHFYPPCEKFDIKSQVKKYYTGKIVLAKDLMKVKI